MQEPSPQTSRVAIAGSLVALILAGTGGFLLGRETVPAPSPVVSAPKPAAAPPVVAPMPSAPRMLTRRDLIELADAAADASASNAPMPASLNRVTGQQFEVFLPFGCKGPAPAVSHAPLQWRYDNESSTLRVRAQPTAWDVSDWWQTPPAGLEALEGFWITRPWSSQEICQPRRKEAAPSATETRAASAETLGLAQFVTKDTPRQLRRGGRPYESVTRVPPEALRIEAGLRLRLRGRVADFPGGKAVRCTQHGGREQRPVCLIGATFDEVAIENPTTQEVLAVWAPTVRNASHPQS